MLKQHGIAILAKARFFNVSFRLKLISFECLSELPPGGDDVAACNGAAVAGGDSEGEGLAVEV